MLAFYPVFRGGVIEDSYGVWELRHVVVRYDGSRNARVQKEVVTRVIVKTGDIEQNGVLYRRAELHRLHLGQSGPDWEIRAGSDTRPDFNELVMHRGAGELAAWRAAETLARTLNVPLRDDNLPDSIERPPAELDQPIVAWLAKKSTVPSAGPAPHSVEPWEDERCLQLITHSALGPSRIVLTRDELTIENASSWVARLLRRHRQTLPVGELEMIRGVLDRGYHFRLHFVSDTKVVRANAALRDAPWIRDKIFHWLHRRVHEAQGAGPYR